MKVCSACAVGHLILFVILGTSVSGRNLAAPLSQQAFDSLLNFNAGFSSVRNLTITQAQCLGSGGCKEVAPPGCFVPSAEGVRKMYDSGIAYVPYKQFTNPCQAVQYLEVLSLPSVSECDNDILTAVSRFDGIELNLGLKTIDSTQALILSEALASLLYLDSAAQILSESARLLGSSKLLGLSLNSVSSLTAGEASYLSRLQCKAGPVSATRHIICRDCIYTFLSLKGLTRLGDSVAQMLASTNVQILNMDGLREITIREATALATFGGKALTLSGLTSIDLSTARMLAPFGGQCLLLGPQTTLAPGVKELFDRAGTQVQRGSAPSI
ncbi:MAG: hypothetical protein WAU88_12385 [Candidatus Zixiibacteriota bacterium]